MFAQRISLFLLRLTLGWLFFYAGITKVLDPEWTAAGYIGAAKTFPQYFKLLLDPKVLPIVNLVNEWGLLLIGVALILGLWVRFTAVLGVLLMILYYLPLLQFPHPNDHSYLVDEHIVYIMSLFVLASSNAGKIWGLGTKLG
jgi:thiosulfate dehydrogenase (quinone) large subunit